MFVDTEVPKYVKKAEEKKEILSALTMLGLTIMKESWLECMVKKHLEI